MAPKERIKGFIAFSLFLIVGVTFAAIYNGENHKIGQLSFFAHPLKK